ncbi:MAG: septum formation inhibitor Maf [Betaproteobacteria bacterium]|nr:septum formation inhibitor Maf [Betaproteobacteria bacterium]
MAPDVNLILASTSPYRRDLLARLQVPFSVADPGVEEQPRAGETAQDMARRLAEAKARAVGAREPGAIVIGCDQVAVADGNIIGKPGDRDNAARQLRALSGREVQFHTALCVHNAASAKTATRLVTTRVAFRVLDDAAIERYLEHEQAYDCAGSAKVEGLGIALIERIEGADPNALIGLPLIALVDLLAEHGVRIP